MAARQRAPRATPLSRIREARAPDLMGRPIETGKEKAMKKTVKPIRLQRETVKQLTDGTLDKVRAAFRENTNYISCPNPHTCLGC
jgi:hypothetical protein